MHWTRRAPELSATSRLVCIWIMTAHPSAAAAVAAAFLVLVLRGLALPRAADFLAAGAAAASPSADAVAALVSTTQRFRLEIGRLSSIRTTSPALKTLFSSCAAYFFERMMNFL